MDMMRSLLLLPLLLTFTLDASPASDLFERMKSLAGEWKGKSTKGWTDRMKVDVIAGGSVVRFVSFDSHPGETMETLMHLDGERLILTHYCIAGNQPRLVATKIAADGATFEFLDGTGMASRDAGHMDKVVYDFPDADHFTSRWTWYSKGEERWMEHVEHERIR
jgi:hypothetical protein